MKWKNVLLGLAIAVFFSLLFLLGVFARLNDQVYDLFLRFRQQREHTNDVVFLDVDDPAIAFNGVFPWPRSIPAEALLRLKEFGARAVIFDIEYIDKGHQGIDDIYLSQGLHVDFDGSFNQILTDALDLINAIRSGSISRTEIDLYTQEFIDFVGETSHYLYSAAQGIARDNDQYLSKASALFGRSWASLNLREEALDDEEQISRRPIAEERFSYPVNALPNAYTGRYVDILPTIPDFARAAEGAGFTNVEIDPDGIRRRIDLTQNIHGHWYLQLAFSPLVNYMGNPELELSRRRMFIKGARMPGAQARDISIPLDGNGRMLLDWPKTDYFETYDHVSFFFFSLLDHIEAQLAGDSRNLATDVDFISLARLAQQIDSELPRLPSILGNLINCLNWARIVKDAALEHCSDEYFDDYVFYREQSRLLIREIIDIDPASRVRALIPELSETGLGSALPAIASAIEERTERLRMNLDRYEEVSEEIETQVRDKFCILGQVNTGTTDMGANPFYSKYINVGTHGVVLDQILSESFIIPIDTIWQVVFTLLVVFIFFTISEKFSPVPRTIWGFIVTFIVLLLAALLFRYTRIFFSPLLAVFAMVTAVILREIIAYAGSEREKQFIRKAFSTYVSDDVVKEIISDPSRLQLGGTKRRMTTMFTDLKGFSSISEKLDPEQLVSLLNRYLTVMSDVVLDEKGTIDKYIGDAIVAFFGAPVDLPDHAYRACMSAIIMKQAEKELNKTILEENLSPVALFTRFGINTGEMVAGNMGTENKMNYTIMGNAVNLAARLESVNKQYGTQILTSGSTMQETGNQFLTRKVDLVRVVGINEPVQLLEILNTTENAEPKEKQIVEMFHAALELYKERKWKEAMEGFQEAFLVEGGGPPLVYIERCTNYLVEPPKDNWDGVQNLVEK